MTTITHTAAADIATGIPHAACFVAFGIAQNGKVTEAEAHAAIATGRVTATGTDGLIAHGFAVCDEHAAPAIKLAQRDWA